MANTYLHKNTFTKYVIPNYKEQATHISCLLINKLIYSLPLAIKINLVYLKTNYIFEWSTVLLSLYLNITILKYYVMFHSTDLA